MSGQAVDGVGHGKVILVGEHAAVYGHAALAGALGCGVRLRARVEPGAAGGGVWLSVSGWDVSVRSGDDSALARAVAAVAEALDVRDALVTGEADVPPGAGLGSSAALAVALVRALAGSCGRVLDDAAVEALADRAERCFHGNPSGIDVAIATRGGMGLYRRGHGLTAIAAPPLSILIGLSGQPRSTADMVARVAAARASRPTEVDAELAALGAAAERAAALLGSPARDNDAGSPPGHGERAAGVAPDCPERARAERGRVEGRTTVSTQAITELGAIFTDAHRRLARLGVSTPLLDAMVDAALAAGAAGAKLTGGGGGGAVIALAPGREDAVLAAWRGLGLDGFVTRVGVATS